MTKPLITKIVIHCSATRNGKMLRTAERSAAQVIDAWHAKRGFRRTSPAARTYNPELRHIGYHFVIDTDGMVDTGRKVGETGAHVRGHNLHSIGICLVGGITADGKNHGEYTELQWRALHGLLKHLESHHPGAKICGHRDLSPDLNGDGKITRNEWVKDCPCFNVSDWVKSGEVINAQHLFKG